MKFLAKKLFFFTKKNPETLLTEEDISLPTDKDLVRAGALLARERNFKDIVSIFVEQSQDISRVDLAAFYSFKNTDERKDELKLMYKRGRHPAPSVINAESELIGFLRECKEAVIFNNRVAQQLVWACPNDRLEQLPLKNKQALQTETAGIQSRDDFFKEVLIHPAMKSGMALPLLSPTREIGILFVASQIPCFFNRKRFHFLDSFAKLASGAMQSSLLFSENKESMQKIDSLERYQENVFNSMTNMIITTNPSGQIQYFNEAAAREMGLKENDLGLNLDGFFKNSISDKTIQTILQSLKDGNEILGLQGIYRTKDKELDYSLNVTPLKTPRGRKEGLTLLFTNQTREKELKQTVQAVSEERRIIKDMFARYMSHEVMDSLMEAPDSIKLGGDKRVATVFFADIRGYTSFSENRDPHEIIEILNEYFSEAVENVVKHKGYIDKFIGDCIMAVWGVPMMPEKNDAVNAVNCALAIQEQVRSDKRKFFRKSAAKLRVGIGINSGPLVAGNLGSMQRMDYSVIGDTVNLAARLESIAGPDEVIVSKSTLEQIDGIFRYEEKPAVRVKGKEKPVQIYNVLGFK